MMSGSTENLLSNSHLSASKESLDGQYYGTQSQQTRRAKQGKTQGMENKGFQDDVRGLEPSSSSEMHSPHGTQGDEKKATSFPRASPKEPPRRHSSPDHNVHLGRERGRARHGGGRRRLSSNIEEDLRRKACLNSMKRHQIANPLPMSEQDEYSYSYSTVPGGQSYNYDDRDKKQPSDEDRRLERSSRDSREPPRRVSSSQKGDEVLNMQQTIIALERNQLEQYKKRLTLALSERAKLTGELQMLSQSLTQREMKSSRHASDFNSLESRSLGRSLSSPRSARLSHSLGDLRVPEMYGDYGDISVDFENNLRLPPVPGSSQSRREKMKIPELDLRSLNSSVERISSDHIENLPEGKELEKDKENTQPLEGGNEGNKNQADKDYFRKMVDEIWEDNLRGDVLAEERIDEKSEDNIQDEIARDSDVNNNEKPPTRRKTRLTVEEFLTNEDSKKQPNGKKDISQQGEVNVLPGYEDMNGTSRGISTGLYEPVECLFGSQSIHANDTVKQKEKLVPHHGEGLLKLKVDDDKPGNSEDYFTASTLPIDKKNKRKEEKHVQGRESETNLTSLRREPYLDEKQPQHISRIGRNERRFNYMVPPGARANASINPNDHNDYLGGKEREKEVPRRVPSNISDKLQYYREKLSNRAEEESSCDLADAYEREKDPKKRREIQQQAAREAAMLRREASALLFEAMNLERICDPNGRVRHVYLPH